MFDAFFVDVRTLVRRHGHKLYCYERQWKNKGPRTSLAAMR